MGYSGRIGLFEAMTIDEDIQKLIISRATSNDIQRAAITKGMVTIRQDGIMKAITRF
jgi:type II secretory ATPase GspE/PulE/Tfp pilus assembly ATPase PilB-like protein